MKYLSFSASLLCAARTIDMSSARAIVKVEPGPDGKYTRIIRDEVDTSRRLLIETETHKQSIGIVENTQRRSLSSDSERSNNVWNIINTMDTYKKGRIFSADSNGRPTLTSYHYVVLPIWWSEENSSSIDVDEIIEALDGAIANHYNQNWGKLEITYEILSQHRLDQSKYNPRWYGTFLSVERAIANQGFAKGQDYDGVMMIHNAAESGMFQYDGGGYGEVNGDFATLCTGLTWNVGRHEIGHNFGHYHHSHNHYNYRTSRPDMPSITDGFDMVRCIYTPGLDHDLSDLIKYHFLHIIFKNCIDERRK